MRLFRTDAVIGPRTKVVLGLSLFVLLIWFYLTGAYSRHRENPDDKIMPLPSQMVDGFQRTALERDRNGDLRLWVDTWASTKRFFLGIALASLVGVLIGVNMGVFPMYEAFLYKFLVFFDKIPALALLPILMIIFTIGEGSKVALIVIGIFPTVTLDTFLRAKGIPRETIHKAQSLGASEHEIAYRVVLPIIFPRVLDTIRLSFKSAALYVIAAESIVAQAGLGYRIFVEQRHLAMDIIVPYVAWMTLVLFVSDLAVQLWIKWRYPWLEE